MILACQTFNVTSELGNAQASIRFAALKEVWTAYGSGQSCVAALNIDSWCKQSRLSCCVSHTVHRAPTSVPCGDMIQRLQETLRAHVRLSWLDFASYNGMCKGVPLCPGFLRIHKYVEVQHANWNLQTWCTNQAAATNVVVVVQNGQLRQQDFMIHLAERCCVHEVSYCMYGR